MTDRRRHRRMEVWMPVEVHSLTHGIIEGVALNLSEGGVMIHTHDRIPLGEKVVVRFGDDIPMMLEGVVRSHAYLDYQGDGAVGGFSGMGIRFTGKVVEEASQQTD